MRRLLDIAAGLTCAWLAAHALAQGLPSPPSPAVPAVDQPLPGPSSQALGPAFDDDASMAVHATAIASYTLTASLDPAKHTLHGEGQIFWRNASRVPQRALYFHLYANAFKNERTLFNRVNVSGFRGAGRLSDWGYLEVTRLAAREMGGVDLWPSRDRSSPGDPEDETDIRVALPEEVPPGGTLTLDVAWDEHLPSLMFRTGHFGAFHMVGQWFPKLARLEPDGRWAHAAFHRLSEFYADFGRYDITVDTPDNVVVGATGQLQGETRSDGRARRRFVQDDVHDFAFTAWDDFRELVGTSNEGVVIRVLYPRGCEQSAAIELDTVRFGLDYLGRAYGRYPYATLTVVHPPAGAEEAGGMEYPTLITTGGPWFMPLTGVRVTEIVTMHELGHQWFYGLVATDEHTWPFLDEGVNSYAEADAMEALFPGASAYQGLGLRVSMNATNRFPAIERGANAAIAQPASAFQSGADYGALIYQRTATLLTTFARVYGEARVRQAIGRYARRYRFDHPGPDELIAAFAGQLGADAAANLRAALFDRASVDYVVARVTSEPEHAPAGIFGDPAHPSVMPAPAEAGIFRGEVLLRRRGALRFPVDVDLIAEDGTVQRTRWEAHAIAETLPYAGKSKLVAAVVDPDHRVLIDDNLANNALRVAPPEVAKHVLERVLFHAQAGLGALLP